MSMPRAHSPLEEPIMFCDPQHAPVNSCGKISCILEHDGSNAVLELNENGGYILRKESQEAVCSWLWKGPSTFTANSRDIVGAFQPTPTSVEIWHMPIHNPKSTQPKRKLKKFPIITLQSQDDAAALVARIQQTSNINPSITSGRRLKRVYVVINPVSGTGRAVETFQKDVLPIWQAAGLEVTQTITSHRGHATELVKKIAADQVDIIAAVGGDGTTYEVLQGLLSREDWNTMRRTPIVQIPGGSGNALAASVGLWDAPTAAFAVVRGANAPLDIASILQPNQPKRFSFLSLTYGTIPCLDLGTEHLRWLGESRFTLGALKEIFRGKTYKMRLAYVEGSCSSDTHTSGRVDQHPEEEGVGSARNLQSADSMLEDQIEQGIQAALIPPINSDNTHGPPLKYSSEFTRVLAQGTLSNSSAMLSPEAWHVEENDMMLFAACNLPHLSTSFKFAPRASHKSGQLELLYAKGQHSILWGLKVFTASDTGGHVDMLERKTPVAMILEPLAAAGQTWVVLDGEELPHDLTCLEVHPGLCKSIIAPEMK